MLSVKSSTRLSVSFAKTPDLEDWPRLLLHAEEKEVGKCLCGPSFWTVNERRYRGDRGMASSKLFNFGRLLKGYLAIKSEILCTNSAENRVERFLGLYYTVIRSCPSARMKEESAILNKLQLNHRHRNNSRCHLATTLKRFCLLDPTDCDWSGM